MTNLIETLLARPGRPTALSRYTEACGAFYLATGLTTYAWPGLVQTLLRQPAFTGHEEGLVRLTGFVLAVVGWFYVAGGRTGARSFAAATVVDRLLVPLFLVPLARHGAAYPPLVLSFAVLDPILALGAWHLLRRESNGSAT